MPHCLWLMSSRLPVSTIMKSEEKNGINAHTHAIRYHFVGNGVEALSAITSKKQSGCCTYTGVVFRNGRNVCAFHGVKCRDTPFEIAVITTMTYMRCRLWLVVLDEFNTAITMTASIKQGN